MRGAEERRDERSESFLDAKGAKDADTEPTRAALVWGRKRVAGEKEKPDASGTMAAATTKTESLDMAACSKGSQRKTRLNHQPDNPGDSAGFPAMK